MYFKAYDKDGNEVLEGQKIEDFRGEEHEFVSVSESGRKVLVKAPGFTFNREFFVGVFNLTVVRIESSKEE